MTGPSLFEMKRVCCCCGAESSHGRRKPLPGDARIVSISGVIYRRGLGKGTIRNAPRVQICETCLVQSLVPSKWGMGSTGSKLWAAMRGSLSESYSAMLEGDKP